MFDRYPASAVYGSDPYRTHVLRTGSGGLMRVNASPSPDGDLPPLNTWSLPNMPTDSAAFFAAGDIRAGDNLPLLSIQVLFLREHNRIAKCLSVTPVPANCEASLVALRSSPSLTPLTDESIFQYARFLLIGEYQRVVYEEFLGKGSYQVCVCVSFSDEIPYRILVQSGICLCSVVSPINSII